jgi:CBS domain-containing protein
MTEAKVYPTYENKEWDKRYQSLYEERLQTIHNQEHTSASLQKSHEAIIKKAICLALKKTESEWGQPPAHFAFFLMGSGGRREQSFWSDQDHGLVYESSNEEDGVYFLHLGEEIVYALQKTGYKLCDGNVMASNKKWCKSYDMWEQQIKKWLKDNTWESLRYTLTFVDSSSFYGEHRLVDGLKQVLFKSVKAQPYLLVRLTENTGRLKKGIGLFNQLLVETKGRHKGKFDFKQIVLFPFVNAIRLLAIEQQITVSSTIERFEKLPARYNDMKQMQQTFEEMLEKRLYWHRHTKHYEDIHHLKLEQLSQLERKQLKKWVREGHKLYQVIERNLKKGESR